MTLPNAYLTSFKNALAILTAIQSAQAPPRFTQKFLQGLGFANSNDRAMINMLKALGFIDDSGVPTSRYHQFLDQTQSAIVLADGIRDGYADLFRVNNLADKMSTSDVKNKMKTLSEGQFTDRVLTQMAGTFTTLVKEADFSGVPRTSRRPEPAPPDSKDDSAGDRDAPRDVPSAVGGPARLSFGGLVYSINIHLPESRDQAVYDALFKALKEHLS
jgi:hypothetical protein